MFKLSFEDRLRKPNIEKRSSHSNSCTGKHGEGPRACVWVHLLELIPIILSKTSGQGPMTKMWLKSKWYITRSRQCFLVSIPSFPDYQSHQKTPKIDSIWVVENVSNPTFNLLISYTKWTSEVATYPANNWVTVVVSGRTSCTSVGQDTKLCLGNSHCSWVDCMVHCHSPGRLGI